jgi:putative glutamine amidotransferase
MAQPAIRIGVTRWEDIPGERSQWYWESARQAGGEVVDLPGPDTSVSGLGGLVLTGGLDVEPERYGEERHPKVKQTDGRRDEFELALLRAALAADLPVLCICRGHQLLNVAFGGKLLQHIEGNAHRAKFHLEGIPSSWHTVRPEPGSRVHAIMGAGEIEINSRHHQAVLPELLAPGLDATAFSPDGLVEAVESRTHRWVVGVQWHPELPEVEHPGFAERCQPLFEALVREARAVREPAR